VNIKIDNKKLIDIHEDLKNENNCLQDALNVYHQQEKNNCRESDVYQSHIETAENLGNELEDFDIN
jgi:hypothetical protein